MDSNLISLAGGKQSNVFRFGRDFPLILAGRGEKCFDGNLINFLKCACELFCVISLLVYVYINCITG